MAPRMFITFVYCYTKNVQPAPLSTQRTHTSFATATSHLNKIVI